MSNPTQENATATDAEADTWAERQLDAAKGALVTVGHTVAHGLESVGSALHNALPALESEAETIGAEALSAEQKAAAYINANWPAARARLLTQFSAALDTELTLLATEALAAAKTAVVAGAAATA